ncbi:hypothetical protein VCRA2122O265_510007 [Vibrio crassostreae]|nr:hypothetical protein VCRA2118O239_470002 [Vibrio crassostreae]CAK2194561.1 hypothetical protein VCRA2110O173_600007 [Vibrio crassostreae]CAK2194807.1 hypothetical protein VCRA2113O207_600002 [Vibrio crassostreae]CAK2366267.1 hypothetical protein VCRA2113O217_450002 [Vibrio crassostreae]CAK2515162.1 hypothetical protein VCRA2119O243_470007 [Vibrio crassostreae]
MDLLGKTEGCIYRIVSLKVLFSMRACGAILMCIGYMTTPKK